jgi:translation elongation factor EF-Tu-like GTPase
VYGTMMGLESSIVKSIMSNGVHKDMLIPNDKGLVLLEKQLTRCNTGDYIIKSGSTKVSKYFEAELNMCEEEEGGPSTPIKCNYKSQVISLIRLVLLQTCRCRWNAYTP